MKLGLKSLTNGFNILKDKKDILKSLEGKNLNITQEELNKIFSSTNDERKLIKFLKLLNEYITNTPTKDAKRAILTIASSSFSDLYYINYFDTIVSKDDVILDYKIGNIVLNDELQQKMYELYTEKYMNDKRFWNTNFKRALEKENRYYIREKLNDRIKMYNQDSIDSFITYIMLVTGDIENRYGYDEVLKLVEEYIQKEEERQTFYDIFRLSIEDGTNKYIPDLKKLKNIDLKVKSLSEFKELCNIENIRKNLDKITICINLDIKDYLEILKAVKEINPKIKVELEDSIKSLDNEKIEKIAAINPDVKVVFGKFEDLKISEIIKASNTLDLYAKPLNEKRVVNGKEIELSPLEKFLGIYKIVTLLKKYKIEGNNENRVVSKNAYQIINGNDDGPIVCAGYVDLMIELMKRCGFKDFVEYYVSIESSIGNDHVTLLFNLVDEKYKIDGLFIADPTYDAKNSDLNPDNYPAQFSHALMTPDQFKTYAASNYPNGEKGIYYDTLIDNMDIIIEHLKNGNVRSMNLKRNNISTSNPSTLIVNDRYVYLYGGSEKIKQNPISGHVLLDALINIQKFVNKTELKVNEELIEEIENQNGISSYLTEKEIYEKLAFARLSECLKNKDWYNTVVTLLDNLNEKMENDRYRVALVKEEKNILVLLTIKDSYNEHEIYDSLASNGISSNFVNYKTSNSDKMYKGILINYNFLNATISDLISTCSFILSLKIEKSL